jgi:hypothetical protein
MAMLSLVKSAYLDHLARKSWICGSGYTRRWITSFRAQKSETIQTRPPGKIWSSPVSGTTRLKDTNLDKLVNLMLKHLLVVVSDQRWTSIHLLGIGIDLKMDFAVRIESKLAREQLWEFSK